MSPNISSAPKKKRDEVEVAYQSLRRFLPELQGPPGEPEKEVRLTRDFKEMEVQSPIEKSRAVMGIIVGIVLLFIFFWAYVLLSKGQHNTPVSTPPPIE